MHDDGQHVPTGHPGGGVLPLAFYDRRVLDVARDLLGAVVVLGEGEDRVAVRVTETEAYAGGEDPASHAYRGPTPRTRVMFGPPGHAYVYLSYGMHWCLNLVCGPAGEAGAVLLRAGEVVDGLPLARARRTSARVDRDLARGPARLTSALGVDRSLDGTPVTGGGALRVLAGPVPDGPVAAGPRVGVSGTSPAAVASGSATWPWRLWLDGDPTVSDYRPGALRRRTGSPGAPVVRQGGQQSQASGAWVIPGETAP